MSNGLLPVSDYWKQIDGSDTAGVAPMTWQPPQPPGSFSAPGPVAGEGYATIPNTTYLAYPGNQSVLAGFAVADRDAYVFMWIRMPTNGFALAFMNENNTDGWNVRFRGDPVNSIFVQVPGGDGNYSDPINQTVVQPVDTWGFYEFWWTHLDSTLHAAFNAGTELTSVILAGGGVYEVVVADIYLHAAAAGGSHVDYGPMGYLNRVPNATQRALLFGGLPFADFDSGGPNPPPDIPGGKPWMKPYNFPQSTRPYPRLSRRW